MEGPGAGLPGRSERVVLTRTPRWSSHKWQVLSVLGLTGVALALVGSHGTTLQRIDSALTLLTPHFQEPLPYEPSPALEAARVILPLVVGFAAVVLLLSFFSQRYHLLRLRRRSGHTVVAGLTQSGLRAARTFAAKDRHIVVVHPDRDSPYVREVLDAGCTVYVGDPTSAETLRAVGVDEATRLVCALLREEDNVTVALTARTLAPNGLEVYARVARPELVGLLEASEVRCFELIDIWARSMLEAGPLAHVSADSPAPHLFVLDTGPLGRAVVLNATRLWHFAARAAGRVEPMSITLVAADAGDVVAELAAMHPAITRTSRLMAVDADPSHQLALDTWAGNGSGTTIYLCSDDEAMNVALARLAAYQTVGLPPSRMVMARGRMHLDDVLAELGPRAGISSVVVVEPNDAKGEFRIDRFTRQEELARAIHDVYGRTPTRLVLPPFDELDVQDRASNRAQAADIPRQLTAVLCRTGELADWDDLLELTPAEIEVQAQLEHVRWAAWRVTAGWRYGPERDDGRRTHPDLVPWTQLPESARDIDRAFARQRTAILGTVGRSVERDPRRLRLAALVHATYLGAASGAAPPQWDAMSDTDQRMSMAFVDALPTMLATVDLCIAHGADEHAPAWVDAAGRERLAVGAHEAWRAAREADGWGWGATRSDSARTHPDLLSWDKLVDERRDVDRRLVDAVPDMLAAVGLQVARVDADVFARAGAPGTA